MKLCWWWMPLQAKMVLRASAAVSESRGRYWHVLEKLDGTAKGGIAVAMRTNFGLPIVRWNWREGR